MSLNNIFDYNGYVKLAPKVGDEPYKSSRQVVSDEEIRTCLECPKRKCRGGVCKRLAEVRRRVQNDV